MESQTARDNDGILLPFVNLKVMRRLDAFTNNRLANLAEVNKIA